MPFEPFVQNSCDFFGVLQLTFPSDITGSLLKSGGILHRAAILLASLGILGICAAVHPRLDDGSRTRAALSGITVVFVAAMMMGIVF